MLALVIISVLHNNPLADAPMMIFHRFSTSDAWLLSLGKRLQDYVSSKKSCAPQLHCGFFLKETHIWGKSSTFRSFTTKIFLEKKLRKSKIRKKHDLKHSRNNIFFFCVKTYFFFRYKSRWLAPKTKIWRRRAISHLITINESDIIYWWCIYCSVLQITLATLANNNPQCIKIPKNVSF